MPSSSDTSGRSRRGSLLILALAFLLLAVVVAIVKLIQAAPSASQAGSASGEGGPPPAAVFVAPVRLEKARYESIVTGTLRAVSRADIAAREPETITEVLADDGDHVAAGTLLVRLDDRRLTAQIAETQAQLLSARELVTQRDAELTRAQADFEMNEGLLADKAISRSTYLDAARTLSVAKAMRAAAAQTVAEAESRAAHLEIRRGDLAILAPFAGIIAERHVEPGEWVDAGQAVMTLVTIDPVEAWMSVPERYLEDLAGHPEGTRVRLSSSGEIFEPVKVTVVPDVEPRSQLFTIVATLDNASSRLSPGQSITGIVPVGVAEPHFVFPVDALVRARAGDFVFVAGDPGEGELPAAEKIPVKIQFERDERAYVRAADAGLKEGDRVVVEGNDRLEPGHPLLVNETGKPVERDPSL